jgi:hypothetical protein
VFPDITYHPVFLIKTQHFEDWILSPFSGKSLLSWAQWTEPLLISELPGQWTMSKNNNCINISPSQIFSFYLQCFTVRRVNMVAVVTTVQKT